MAGKYTKNLCEHIYSKHGRKQKSLIADNLREMVKQYEEQKESKPSGPKRRKAMSKDAMPVMPYKKDDVH